MDRRTEREYRDALDDLRFSDEVKARMMKNLTEHKEGRPMKRWDIRPLRVGLIAACLCLALAGGAAAAQLFGVQMRLFHDEPNIFTSRAGTGYVISGEIEFQTVDSFSEQVIQMAKEHPSERTGRHFTSWSEAEEFIGMELYDNQVLEDAEDSKGHQIWLESNADGDLRGVDIASAWRIDRVSIDLESHIYTEYVSGAGHDHGTIPLAGYVFPGKQMRHIDPTQETYTTPSGLEVQIVWMNDSRPTEGRDRAIAAFFIDGILYRLSISSGPADPYQDVLYQVLDGFQ